MSITYNKVILYRDIQLNITLHSYLKFPNFVDVIPLNPATWNSAFAFSAVFRRPTVGPLPRHKHPIPRFCFPYCLQ